MVRWGRAAWRLLAVPESRAAWQAAVSPSIRRWAAVRRSWLPPGGLNASAAVRMISIDRASLQAPLIVPTLSRVIPKDR